MPRFITIVSLLLAPTLAWSAPDASYEWTAPAAAVQVARDETTVEADQGAIFVPTLTDHPAGVYALAVNDEAVRRVPIGKRAGLPPGDYVVMVGSGEPGTAVKTRVRVVAGRTSVVPVTWGGLDVEVLTKSLRPTTWEYKLVHQATGEVIAVPRDLLVGESAARTWLLAPGLYRLQATDGRGVNRPDFTTVYVPEAGLVHLRAFVDRAGSLVGAGQVEADDTTPGDDQEERWGVTVGLGAQGAWSRSRGFIGNFDNTVANGSLLLDGAANYTDDKHLLSLKGSAKAGMLLVQPSTGKPLPLIKLQDALSATASYTYLINDGVGVWTRIGGQTRLLPTAAVASENTEIAYRMLDGSVRYETIKAADTYEIAPAFSPTVIRADAGLKARLSTIKELDISLRGGVGYRQYILDGAYVPQDNPDTPAIELTEAASFAHPGIVAGADVGFGIGRFATYAGSVDLFSRFDRYDDIIMESNHAVGLRLTDHIGLNYEVTVDRIPQVSERYQISQAAFLRAAWTLL